MKAAIYTFSALSVLSQEYQRRKICVFLILHEKENILDV